MSSCERGPIRQISTGTDEQSKNQQLVNHDFEQLYQRVNDMQACINKLSQFATSISGGSFAGGDGSTSAPIMGQTGAIGSAMVIARQTSAVDFPLPDGFAGIILINATANINVTLPRPQIDQPITIMNTGASHMITVKDDLGVSLTPMINAGGVMTPMQQENSTGVPTWMASSLVQYPDGSVTIGGQLVLTNSTLGLIMTSPDATTYMVTMNNGGTLSIAGAIPSH